MQINLSFLIIIITSSNSQIMNWFKSNHMLSVENSFRIWQEENNIQLLSSIEYLYRLKIYSHTDRQIKEHNAM